MNNSITAVTVINSISIVGITTLVEPAILNPTVSIDGLPTQVLLSDDKVTVSLVDSPVAVEVQSASISVITGATQGPQGPIGVTGPTGPTNGDEISVLNKSERKNTVEDSPSTGDITVYYGIAIPQSLNNAAVWLITRTIYLADGGAFDSEKKYASLTENKIWDNHLSFIYT